MNFKPFWLETNQLFQAVMTETEFEEVKEKFNISSPGKDILSLNISRYHLNSETKQLNEDKQNLLSFGSCREHIHLDLYTLGDYFEIIK